MTTYSSSPDRSDDDISMGPSQTQTEVESDSESDGGASSDSESDLSMGSESDYECDGDSDIDDKLSHVDGTCITEDDDEKHCLVCTASSSQGLAPLADPGRARLQVLQFIPYLNTDLMKDLVKNGALTPGRCANPNKRCERPTHRKENFILLCAPHARLFRSRSLSAGCMLFVPYTEDLMVLWDEELMERERYVESKINGKPEDGYKMRTVDQIARDCNFPLSYICLIVRRGSPHTAIKVDLHISPVIPIAAFVENMERIGEYLLHDCISKHLEQGLDELSDVGESLIHSWIERNSGESYTLMEEEAEDFARWLHALRGHWRAGGSVARSRCGAEEHLAEITAVYKEADRHDQELQADDM